MARKRLRTRSLPMAELRRLIPAMDEHLARVAEPGALAPTGRVWFGRDGRVTTCEAREKGSRGCDLIRHTMRFR